MLITVRQNGQTRTMETGTVPLDPAKIAAEFLSGVTFVSLCRRHNVDRGQLRKILNSRTTPEQRREMNAIHHRRRSRETMRRKQRKTSRRTTCVSYNGVTQSIRQTAANIGIAECTAKSYHKAGVPPEKWLEEKERRRRHRARAIRVGGEPSIAAAAAAAGIAPRTAHRYMAAGIPPEEWHETLQRNKATSQGER